MARNSKKKKDKNADFVKPKLKLGKGKKPSNVTDTSFKARSITLPYQGIGQEKGASVATTRRNLTIDDLLIHLKHYNPNIRKDAIHGLREILESHPQLVITSLSPIIQTCARTVSDEDTDVRKVLLDFFSWLLRLAPLKLLQPHAPLLILFITSAQTHIFPAIRIDAVRFLNLLLEIVPEMVTKAWDESESTGNRVLEGYLALLGVSSGYDPKKKGDTSVSATSGVTLSLNSKLIVLSSLVSYLRAALTPSVPRQHNTISFWDYASSFSDDFQISSSLIQPSTGATAQHREWNDSAQVDFEDFVGNFLGEWTSEPGSGFSLEELGNVGQAADSLTSGGVTAFHSVSKSLRIANLAHSLHPVLLSIWLDVAPTVFGVGTSGGGVELEIAGSIGNITLCLYGAIFRSQLSNTDARVTAFNDLATLLGYMSTYLPYISETNVAQPEQFLQSLNFAYCELTALAITELQHVALKPKQNKSLLTQIDGVGNYIVQILDGELKSPSHPLGYSLTASSYASLLPTIWLLLRCRGVPENDTSLHRVFTATVRHAIRTPSKSATKAIATQFVGTLVLMNSHPKSSLAGRITFTADEGELLKEWFVQLPKVLWEVGGGDHVLTETILRLLLRIGQRRLPLFDMDTFMSVQSRLAPYFFTAHPEKGGLMGPFSKLKQYPSLRQLALDVTFALIRDSLSSEGNALRMAVDKAVDGTPDARHWSTLLHSLSFRHVSKR